MNMRTIGWQRFRKGMIGFVALVTMGSLLSNFVSGTDNRLPADLALPGVSMTAVWPPDELAGKELPTVHTDEWRGQNILLTFWATWCGYCLDEMPLLEKLHQDYAESDLHIVAVSDERRYGAIRRIAESKGVTYSIYADAGALFRHYKVDGRPFHVFIGPDGKVAGDIIGQMNERDARDRIDDLLNR